MNSPVQALQWAWYHQRLQPGVQWLVMSRVERDMMPKCGLIKRPRDTRRHGTPRTPGRQTPNKHPGIIILTCVSSIMCNAVFVLLLRPPRFSPALSMALGLAQQRQVSGDIRLIFPGGKSPPCTLTKKAVLDTKNRCCGRCC